MHPLIRTVLRTNSCTLVIGISLISSAAFAEGAAKGADGVLIYSRPVPSRPAEIRGEPAAPNQVDLTAAVPWKSSLQPMEVLTDSEAAAIGASAGREAAGLVGGALIAALGDGGLPGGAAQVLQGQGGGHAGGALSAMTGALGTAGSAIGSAVGAALVQGRN